MTRMTIPTRTTRMRCHPGRHVPVFAPMALAIAEWHPTGKLSTAMAFSISAIVWLLPVRSNFWLSDSLWSCAGSRAQ